MNSETKKNPRISIIIASRNTGKFLEATLDSIFAQDFKDFECIVMDGASTDDTLEKLKKYPHVEVHSQKDSCSWEAFCRGLTIAKGDYVMACCVSDGYLDMNWFSKCVQALDANPEVSLVWGLPQYMSEDGKLLNVSYPQFKKKSPEQKEEFFYYWLASAFWLPEGNFCVRMNVMKECFPPFFEGENKRIEAWLEIHANFNARGYMPLFLPVVASYGRIHKGQSGQREVSSGMGGLKFKAYLQEVRTLRRALLLGGAEHHWRDGEGRELPYAFSRWHFFSSQFLSWHRLNDHLGTWLRYRAKLAVYFLESKKLMPGFLHDVIFKKREAGFGVNEGEN